MKLGPPKFRRFLVDLLPFKNVRRLRDIVDLMHNTCIEILDAKRHALMEGEEAFAKQTGKGKDIISILCMCISFISRCMSCLTPSYSTSESQYGSIGRRQITRF